MAVLYYELQPRPELVRKVNLGPFEISQDDGLPLRKAAFTALDTVMTSDKLADRVGAEIVPLLCGCVVTAARRTAPPAPSPPRIAHSLLRSGLRDNDEVKVICHGLITKLVASPSWQAFLIADLNSISAALVVALEPSKEAPSADIVRSTLRTINAIQSSCTEAMSVPLFAVLATRCERTDTALAPIMAQIRSEAGRF